MKLVLLTIKHRIFCVILLFVFLAVCSLRVTVLPSSVNLLVYFQPNTHVKLPTDRSLIRPSISTLASLMSLEALKESIRKNRLSSSSINNNVGCRKVFANDSVEINRAKNYAAALRERSTMTSTSSSAHTTYFANVSENCGDFLHRHGYLMFPTSQEELDFPIAFSILMYKNVQQFERLLRTIYRPNNYYCVHVDFKIDDADFRAVRAITDCLPNVFLASKRYNVYWGHISLLYAELTCMRDLLKYSWRYLINLSGQMYPLHSNKFIVQFAKSLNGSNDIEAVP